MIYIGIDPGAQGGIAAIMRQDGVDQVVAFSAMLRTEESVWRLLQSMQSSYRGTMTVIEEVGGYIGEGQPGSRAFKFGQSYGMLRGMMAAAGLLTNGKLLSVRPQQWQKDLGIPPRKKRMTKGGGETKYQFKSRLKRVAKERFPGLRITRATADALLLALWLRDHGKEHFGL